MERKVCLVDRGRGLQLSSSRITVHDLVPYFQQGYSHDEVIRWLPSLNVDEIEIAKQYYEQHQEELDEYERRVRVHREEKIRLQRLRFPELQGSRDERLARLEQHLRKRRPETNGEGARS